MRVHVRSYVRTRWEDDNYSSNLRVEATYRGKFGCGVSRRKWRGRNRLGINLSVCPSVRPSTLDPRLLLSLFPSGMHGGEAAVMEARAKLQRSDTTRRDVNEGHGYRKEMPSK